MFQSSVKFKQVYPSMYGGFYALDEDGQIWQYDRYDAWKRILAPVDETVIDMPTQEKTG